VLASKPCKLITPSQLAGLLDVYELTTGAVFIVAVTAVLLPVVHPLAVASV